jgi:hypothetical protein
MKDIRLLRIEFDAQLEPYEVPAFRGAIVHKVGRQHDAFHNHLDDQRYAYRYPLIQYKSLYRHPAIVCIGEGVDEIHKFFEQRDWTIHIGERRVDMRIAQLDLKSYQLRLDEYPFRYQLSNWIALNQASYQSFSRIESMVERIEYLEKKLIGNILSMAKGLDWFVEDEILLRIIDLRMPHHTKYKQNKLMDFQVVFETNAFLPNYIGLGGKVSVGYGVVRQVSR